MSRFSSKGLTSCEAESFQRLCLWLESLHLKKKEDKLTALETFLKRFDVTCDLFPLLRLLLPSVDHERSTYGLKESNLAKLYGDVLGLPEAQRQRLLRWKDPTLQEGYRCAAGDFASVLYSVAESRATVQPGAAALTLGDLNAALDAIHDAPDAAEKRARLLELARRASATEQKWIAKIILKDLKVGFSHESVLKRYHPDAMELYNRSSMLRQVLDAIRAQYVRAREVAEAGGDPGADASAAKAACGPGEQPGGGGGSFGGAFGDPILFSKFKPMLAQRLNVDGIGKVVDGKITWSCEMKYDGERILAHVDVAAQRVELYTRNAIDYTSTYAPTMRKVFLSAVNGRQAVLDGEMLAWDEAEQTFVPFGSNRTVAQGGDPNKHLCFMAFDVLFYMDADGQVWDLRRTKLMARRELLEKVIAPKPSWLEVAPSLVTASLAEIQTRLEGAIEMKAEGLVLKDMSSRYFFNARKKGWHKLKPEYDEQAETLDLLVVGAFFGDSSRRRTGGGMSADLADNMSQFLVAVLEKDGKGAERALTVGRVGTGFSMDKLKEMRGRLRPHLRRYDPHRTPPWLGGWRGTGKTKPDCLIDSLSNGFVMEVRAAEIVPSDEYEFGHTLRFPRAAVPIREDKDWCDACTEDELRGFLRDGRGLLTSKRPRAKVEVQSEGEDTDDGASPKKKRRSAGGAGAVGVGPARPASSRGPMRGRSFGVLEGFRGADTGGVPVASTMLAGAEVFVLNGDAQYSKSDLESYVVRHGGRNMQNFIRGRTSLIVAATASDLRARNLIRSAQVDIIKYGYLFSCETAGKILPMQPRYLLAASPETSERFKHAFDRYGDAFYEDVTPASLKETLESVPEEDAQAVPEELVAALASRARFRPPPTVAAETAGEEA